MENFNFSRSIENQDVEKREEEKESFDPKRREFIKKGAVALTGLALSGSFWEMLRKKPEEEKKEEVSLPEKSTEEQEKIEEENITSLCEVLDYDKEGEVKLDSEKMEAIKNHWKKRYQEVPELKRSLEQAYRNMGEWYPYLEDQFKEKGVPEKYLYLAIPESHWQLDAVSSVGAVGPYQFMPKTARSYGLKTKHFKDHHFNIEERKDPIKSSSACASLLKDLYRASGDWDMSLAGYNGGFFWRYLKKAKEEGVSTSYNGFLGYLEERTNKAKKEVESSSYHQHKIKSGESMIGIAKRFNLEVDEICRINDIEDSGKIYEGQLIKIPTSSENKKELFKNKIRGIVQNLNYPPKFNAIYELIEEGFVKERKSPINFAEKKVEGDFQKKHIFKKEDLNIYRLSLKLGISSSDILKVNPHIDPSKMKGGEELTIPGGKKEATLEKAARDFKTDLVKLKEINPAVEDSSKPLPTGYGVRVYQA